MKNIKYLALAFLFGPIALGQTTKTDISIDCASTTARIGGQLCSALRDAVDRSAKYEEHIGTPDGYALRIVAVDINDGTQTAVSMTLLYRWTYVSSAVQVCSPSGLNECAHTMMSSVDEDIKSFKDGGKDQVATQRHS